MEFSLFFHYFGTFLFVQLHLGEGALILTTSPSKILAGMTPTLTVNCSFVPDQASTTVENLISLILSGASNSSLTPAFQELASVNTFSGLQSSNISHLHVTGSTGDNGDAYLNLVLDNPSLSDANLYRCVGYGMDYSGHPIDVVDTIQISIDQPDIEALVDKINLLESLLESMSNQVQGLSSQMAALQNELSSCQNSSASGQASLVQLTIEVEMMNGTLGELQTDGANNSLRLDALETFQDNWRRNLRYFNQSVFKTSSFFRGHRYYLTKVSSPGSMDDAEGVCEVHGGFLAEIEDAEEYNFVQSYVRSEAQDATSVYIGGTDSDVEGQWVFHHSGKPVPFLDWATNEPSGNRVENCLDLYRYGDWRMNDNVCDGNADHTNILCEIPE